MNSTAPISIYKNRILPILEHGDVLLVSAKARYKKKMQILQNKALKRALGLDPFTDTDEVHAAATINTLAQRRNQHLIQIMYKQLKNAYLWKREKTRRSGATTRSGNKILFCYQER